MAILFTGDLHGAAGIKRLDPVSFPEGEVLDRKDFVIIAGDFGVIQAHGGITREEHHLLEWLSQRPWTTLFIDGNHEHMPRLLSLPLEDRFGGRVGRAARNVYYLRRGERYDIDGRLLLCLGGAFSIDRANRVCGETWFQEEIPTLLDVEATKRSAAKGPVDVMLTHTCPSDIKTLLPLYLNSMSDPTEHILSELRPLAQPRFWIFGHHHVNWRGYEEGIHYTCLFDEIALLDPKLGIIPLGKKPLTRTKVQGAALIISASNDKQVTPKPKRPVTSTRTTLPTVSTPSDGFRTWGGE
ncbi:MAG: metallophosphoesterase [Deltaproteobacteria bacterium]